MTETAQTETDPMGGFEPGDVVKLRSDGPLMTVNGVSPETEMLICMWFAMPQGICMMGGFHPKALELHKARVRPPIGKVTKLRPVDAG
jgi:uncharacterized protein YodC (DUF2158 family)